jgi:hypothetical protein
VKHKNKTKTQNKTKMAASQGIVQPSTLLQAAQLNNAGVELIESGRYMDAMAVLRQSLSLTRELQVISDRQSHSPEEGEEASTRYCEQSYLSYEYVEIQASPLKNNIPTSDRSALSEMNTTFPQQMGGFTFDRPIKFVNVSREESYCPDCFLKLPFAVVFNLAMAHHSFAMEKDSSEELLLRESCLHKALRLYEVAHSIMCDRAEAQQQHPDLTVFEIIVIVNNIAEVYKALKDEASALKCSHQVLAALMLLVDTRAAGDIFAKLEGVMDNAFSMLFQQNCRVSPAA